MGSERERVVERCVGRVRMWWRGRVGWSEMGRERESEVERWVVRGRVGWRERWIGREGLVGRGIDW